MPKLIFTIEFEYDKVSANGATSSEESNFSADPGNKKWSRLCPAVGGELDDLWSTKSKYGLPGIDTAGFTDTTRGIF